MARNRGFDVQVDGIRGVRRSLNRVDSELPKELRQINLKAARIVQADAERFVPRRTGQLAGTLGSRASTTSASVKAGTNVRTPYAPPIHWGWKARGIKAQEFIYKAIVVNKDKITKLYSKDLQKLIKRAGLNRRF